MEGSNEFEEYLSTHFWPTLTAHVPVREPVTNLLFSKLSEEQVAAAEEAVPAERRAELKLNRKGLLLKAGTHFLPEISQALGLPSAAPPADVHRMQRGDPLWCGDIYSANMLGQALEDARLAITVGGRYLDFGCSSGSLTRVAAAAYPDSEWFGVDPVSVSIEWARQNLPAIQFDTSNQRPPLDFPSGYFDGVYAISVWSHFSENMALAWFAEMGRVIRSGGWLMFTTHGLRSLSFFAGRNHRRVAALTAVLKSMIEKGYGFDAVAVRDGLDKTHWGNAFFDVTWVARTLRGQWKLVLFQPGRNQSNQDVYVLVRLE